MLRRLALKRIECLKNILSHQGSLRAPTRGKTVGTLCFLKLSMELKLWVKLSTFLRSPANISDKEASRNVYNTALNSFPSSMGTNLKCTTNEELKSFGNVCKPFTWKHGRSHSCPHIFLLLTFLSENCLESPPEKRIAQHGLHARKHFLKAK